MAGRTMSTPRKPAHGGARPGAGAKRTTGSRSTRPVFFRLTADQRARAEAVAAARPRPMKVNALARELLLAEIGAVDAPGPNRVKR